MSQKLSPLVKWGAMKLSTLWHPTNARIRQKEKGSTLLATVRNRGCNYWFLLH